MSKRGGSKVFRKKYKKMDSFKGNFMKTKIKGCVAEEGGWKYELLP